MACSVIVGSVFSVIRKWHGSCINFDNVLWESSTNTVLQGFGGGGNPPNIQAKEKLPSGKRSHSWLEYPPSLNRKYIDSIHPQSGAPIFQVSAMLDDPGVFSMVPEPQCFRAFWGGFSLLFTTIWGGQQPWYFDVFYLLEVPPCSLFCLLRVKFDDLREMIFWVNYMDQGVFAGSSCKRW